jgi:hypothetical protein
LEDTLPPEKRLGPVDPATVVKAEDEEDEKPMDIQGIPPIHQVINIDDFEVRTRCGRITDDRNYHKEMLVLELGHTIPLPPMMNYVFSIFPLSD